MSINPLKPVLLAAVMTSVISCQPQDSARHQEEAQKELASLKQDLKQEIAQLRQEVASIGAQVKEIHTIATASQQPQFRSLPTQSNLDNDGQLPFLGEAEAQVAILEFSDFQCPYCKRYIDKAFSKIKTQYIDTGKVRYLTRHFPLSFHPKAQGAAVAASCAQQQQAYWPMRETLFANISKLDDALYQQTATKLTLDMTRFNACLKDEQIADKIAMDTAYGSSIGIRGTPSFIIGRVENNRLLEPKLVVGAQSYETFATLLDNLMETKAAQ
ncbi:thioredoxin domain-containing protein [Shewanella salipaludis]|uniref:Thioredoxin domain-containing protein n=1 Tax=Shewanella salipaludis TaxID=2723052 RepID=A0A972FQW1_9GAMM|nr:thioredoxin domain-containing protein [Shewanella salipaludis]NMH63604.1 thioredoxin domain-containing protein [Shewanella salipaludis]